MRRTQAAADSRPALPVGKTKPAPLSEREVLALVLLSLGLLLAWDLSARQLQYPQTFPWPRYLIDESLPGFAPTSSGKSVALALLVLLYASAVTAMRVIGGTVLGVLFGVVTGLAIFSVLRWSDVGDAFMSSLRGIPLLALIPLFVAWFGDLPTTALYTYIAYCVAVIVATDTFNLLVGLSPDFRNALAIIHQGSMGGST